MEVSVATAQWLLYVPPGLTLMNAKICPHSVFTCFVWTSEQTVHITAQDGQRQMKVPLNIHAMNLKNKSITKIFIKVRSCNTDISTSNVLPIDRLTTKPVTGRLINRQLGHSQTKRTVYCRHTFSGGCKQGESKIHAQISDASSHIKTRGKVHIDEFSRKRTCRRKAKRRSDVSPLDSYLWG